MSKETKQVNEDYMEDAQGRKVPVSMIKEIDIKRDAMVKEVMAAAFAERERLAAFKKQAWAQISAFVIDSEKDSNARKLGGKKGNITLTTYDGKYMLKVAVNDGIQFSEKLQIAKQLIDKCVTSWAADARPEIKVLVEDAFNVGKSGMVSTGKILGLRRLDIKDPTWRKAMDAISESIQVVSSKTYIRFYERDSEGAYRQIPLDVASL